MEVAQLRARTVCTPVDPDGIPDAVTETDRDLFFQVVSVDLTPDQIRRVEMPDRVHPRQKSVLAAHWHPEFIPMPHIERRIRALFPNAEESLVVPTQHNEILSYGEFSGVETDCYSPEFNLKVQLLLHFDTRRLENAHVLRNMMAHTYRYRSSQLLDFLHTLNHPVQERISQAARDSGADEYLIQFVRKFTRKIEDLIDAHHDRIPPDAMKNKILRNFFDLLRETYGDLVINRVQTFLTAVKQIVKANFSTRHFYRTREIIEEVRALGGGIVIPHPEQFWPILLAEYDVDGVEVWNPQSRQYTEFLIGVLDEKNRRRGRTGRPLLVFMGDDTHMGEKVKEPAHQDRVKALREVGVQPAWDDLAIRKRLILTDMDRDRVVREYRDRLTG